MESDPNKSVAAFFAGRSIFITGGTGFMGKALIEKLLRSCPDVKELFLLMRPKKNLNIDDRLRKMIAGPLFDKLRETNPSSFEKLIPVSGDVIEEGLGLPAVERSVLIQRVSVIFHAAANVRFDDPLKYAILLNTRGTREVCNLATNMKQLVVLLHVSTTYGNTDRAVIDEVLYPAHTNWKEAIKIAETVDDHTLDTLTAKFLGKLPNTYTFTKQIAEHVINDYAEVLPSVIFRPSVVISSVSDPIPGWIDNFNGPVGLLVGGGKGILRSIYGSTSSKIDFMPVDIAIKAMIIAAWLRGKTPITKEPAVSVYNCASGGMKAITTGDMISLGFRVNSEIPLDGTLWHPHTAVHSVKLAYSINFFIFHIIPALLIDSILKLSGMKPRLLGLQRKIFTANHAVQFFMSYDWKIENTKLLRELEVLPEVNKADFNFSFHELEQLSYVRSSVIGAKKYLLKEDMNKLDEAKAHFNRMWWIDRAVKVWFGVFCTWGAVNFGLVNYVLNTIPSIFGTWLGL